jgi:hypothetical protein
MLRMRLSLDCGCSAVPTQGGSDHLFTVESPAVLKRLSIRLITREATENVAHADILRAVPDAECIELSLVFGMG